MSNDYPPPGSGQDPTGQSGQPPPPPPSEPQWNPQSAGTPPESSGGSPGYGQQPYGQPPSYPPPPPGAPGGYGQPQKTSPLAIVSLVLGIIGLPCCYIFVFGIAAVVTGVLARKQIDESQGALKGAGMAMGGLVLGIVTIVAAIVLWILNLSGIMEQNYAVTG
jgi:hypothetical protein